MRLLGGVDAVEHLHPFRPRAAGLFAHRVIGHAGDVCVIRSWLGFLDDADSRGGVSLAGFLHARADEALEVFLFGHDVLLSIVRERDSPAAPTATTKVRHTDPGVRPPLPRR